jgi:cell division septation protein DedD
MSRSANLVGGMLVGLLGLSSCQNGSPPASKPSAQGGSSPRPAPVAVKIPAETVSPLRPHFAVQVAAFDQRAPAERLAARLSDEFGYQTMVAPVELGGKTLFRVRILVRTKDEADNLANTLASKAKVRAWVDPIP